MIMKAKARFLAYVLAVVVLAVQFVACAPDDTENSPLVGKWKLVMHNGQATSDYEVYTFYESGRGERGFKDSGVAATQSFDWSSHSGDYLELNYGDGTYESRYYRFAGENLELSFTAGFDNYNTYKPVN